MKTRLLFSTFLASALILTGCANKDSNQDDKQHHTTASQVPKHVKKLKESDIFTSNKKNADISEKEMKEALTKYLAVNNDILDNKYYMQHELDKQSDSQTKVTDKQADRLSELSNLTVKNDLHFKNFVADNHIPKSYDKNTQRIINYFKALNSAISNVDETIEKLSYQPQNSINIVDVPTNYAGDVNKSQQDKIKDFLKSKDIPTDAINK
ncbi:NDxxF motif lipoprotein [Staphylococcus simiae]|uniref:NDxxF motif lipoprotein n=1 Tax=Staphylococcus simiae TaxID=308354 RepID=UPI001A968A39|nr:NDxxF motif lipoprotein [Staphylococcus simiae]MBO1199308.1 NDxxF motif lipoprotein [Staphylococcus simiae]MBO1201541.1 NDxxF motif lipoprotein [Staphylococcus simiae]MBO1203712.1 NDxxF motif lipoprotein [Staphylococcus simiae]MBO1211323.1 NDxxF motif lipoprotein [Staphylococcus simiae]MBO1229922.1 NDxxF motif lipoprotein [Staphylococcus simiae]